MHMWLLVAIVRATARPILHALHALLPGRRNVTGLIFGQRPVRCPCWSALDVLLVRGLLARRLKKFKPDTWCWPPGPGAMRLLPLLDCACPFVCVLFKCCSLL